MKALEGKRALIVGEGCNLLDTILRAFAEEGARVHTLRAQDSGTSDAPADAVVFVAEPPHAQPSEATGDYVARVLAEAADAAGRIADIARSQQSVTLVAPSVGSTLHNNIAAVSAAIGALKGLCRAWAVEKGDCGVRTNLILPGILAHDVSDGDSWPTIPLERPGAALGSDLDVALAAVFLASADASYINGAEIKVDGGLSEDRHSVLSVAWAQGLLTPDRNPITALLQPPP